MCHSSCVPDWGGTSRWSMEKTGINHFFDRWELKPSTKHSEETIHLRILADHGSLIWTVYSAVSSKVASRKKLLECGIIICHGCISSTPALTVTLFGENDTNIFSILDLYFSSFITYPTSNIFLKIIFSFFFFLFL